MIQAPSVEGRTPRIRDYALAATLAATFALSGGAKPTEAEPVQAAGLGDCAPYFDNVRYRNHEYEVCTAYIANSAKIALQGFYKFGNNSRGYLADPARHHFRTRYWEGPRYAIERDVDSWPTTGSFTGNRVNQNIDLVSLSSNLKADRGLLHTKESWRVTSPSGQVLHNERRHNRYVTMCRGRLPGHPLHAWVVVKYNRDPGFDCIAFDRRHNLRP